VFEFVEKAIAYPNLPLNTVIRSSVLFVLNRSEFPLLSYFFYHQLLGEKIVHHNLKESCYVVKERELTLSALYRAIPPPGNMYGARIEMRVCGRAF
jgi:hypothetical protein